MEKIEKTKTKLSNKYAFWFRISKDTMKNKTQNQNNVQYESQIKKISEFDTIEDFWAIYQHLKTPDKCEPGIDIHLFKEPIKPLWEDDSNKNGGKLTIKCNKGYTSIIWEEIILGLLGCLIRKDLSDEINGIVFKSKQDCNLLEIWVKISDKNNYSQLEQSIRDLIQIPNEVPINFKKFYNDNNNNNKGYKSNNSNYNNNNQNYYGYHYNNNNRYYNKNKKYYY